MKRCAGDRIKFSWKVILWDRTGRAIHEKRLRVGADPSTASHVKVNHVVAQSMTVHIRMSGMICFVCAKQCENAAKTWNPSGQLPNFAPYASVQRMRDRELAGVNFNSSTFRPLVNLLSESIVQVFKRFEAGWCLFHWIYFKFCICLSNFLSLCLFFALTERNPYHAKLKMQPLETLYLHGQLFLEWECIVLEIRLNEESYCIVDL